MSFNKTPLKTKNINNSKLNRRNIVFDSVLDYLSYSNSLNPGTTETLNTLYLNLVFNNNIRINDSNNSEGRNKNEYTNYYKDNKTKIIYENFIGINNNSKIIEGTYGNSNSIQKNKIINGSNNNIKHKTKSLYTETTPNPESQGTDSNSSNKKKFLVSAQRQSSVQSKKTQFL